MSALGEHELVRQAGSTPERIRQLVSGRRTREVAANRAAAEAAQAVTLVPLGQTLLKGGSTAVPLFRLDADGHGAGG